MNRLKNKAGRTPPSGASPKKEFKETVSIDSKEEQLYKQEKLKRESSAAKMMPQHSRSVETICCSSNRTTQSRLPSGQLMSHYGLQSATLEKSANQEAITATFKPTMSCEKLPNSAKRQEQPALSKKALMLEII